MADPQEITDKQRGDACEMLVTAELTLANIPSIKMPDNWPGYDIIAQPFNRPLQRISVKCRTFKRSPGYLRYGTLDEFDWLAIVLLPGDDLIERQIYLLPRAVADALARAASAASQAPHRREWRIDRIPQLLARYRDNFRLLPDGVDHDSPQKRKT